MPASRKMAVLLICSAACAGVLWIWCYYTSQSPTIVIKIGALLPAENGDLAENRKMMIRGMELAKEDIDAKYKGQVVLDFDYQNGCFAKESIPAVQKFSHDQVPIIAASFCLFGHLPILPVTEGNKIITFNTAANPDQALNLQYAFSTNVEVKNEAQRLSQFAFKELGARRAVTMFLDTPFGHDYDKYFTFDFNHCGGDVVGSFPNAPDGKQFKSMISQIKLLKPDIIITAHFGLPLAMFIKEVRQANINVPILGNYETEDPTVINYAGDAAEGVMFSSSELNEKTPIMNDFERRYIRKFGAEPNVLVTNVYDDVVLSVDSYLACKNDRDCMANYLHQISNYQGVSGTITINPSGATNKPTIFKIIKNHTFIPYQKYQVNK
ncbi:Leucine-specific-binding protein precursor [Legionella moravica]|uniref:Leucine-specific-binding protein n=1 Tax=Legionella moravica TaxID=39962 RepID=A0A378K313_9GAMM|nr:ABC transporter substrate-binding protein [Legionella moravica]KTD31679.1 Leucine-specific-binding protein precursor [Legionella moravica]STX62241.1 Leucine-specific-binding protein precursor [Legionella moravica]